MKGIATVSNTLSFLTQEEYPHPAKMTPNKQHYGEEEAATEATQIFIILAHQSSPRKGQSLKTQMSEPGK